MIFLLFSTTAAVIFFVGSLVLLNQGRNLGRRHLVKEGSGAISGVNALEGTVFALMGLLLAFSISGVLQRFDERRLLILQEANTISTAYDRLDLFEREVGLKLKAKLKDYLQARISLYSLKHDISFSNWSADFNDEQEAKILALKAEVWDGAATACSRASSAAACSLVLPSLNSAFEVARLRAGVNEKHPPIIVYAMLFGLGLGASLLAGFGMAAAKRRSWIHIVVFAASLSFVFYVLIEMEYPRLGFIRVDAFDHFLVDVHEQMH